MYNGLLIATLVFAALATIVLGVFMLLDARKRSDGTDLTSRITRAVDRTAKANGLWTRLQRIQAIVFIVLLLVIALLLILLNQTYGR